MDHTSGLSNQSFSHSGPKHAKTVANVLLTFRPIHVYHHSTATTAPLPPLDPTGLACAMWGEVNCDEKKNVVEYSMS